MIELKDYCPVLQSVFLFFHLFVCAAGRAQHLDVSFQWISVICFYFKVPVCESLTRLCSDKSSTWLRTRTRPRHLDPDRAEMLHSSSPSIQQSPGCHGIKPAALETEWEDPVLFNYFILSVKLSWGDIPVTGFRNECSTKSHKRLINSTKSWMVYWTGMWQNMF